MSFSNDSSPIFPSLQLSSPPSLPPSSPFPSFLLYFPILRSTLTSLMYRSFAGLKSEVMNCYAPHHSIHDVLTEAVEGYAHPAITSICMLLWESEEEERTAHGGDRLAPTPTPTPTTTSLMAGDNVEVVESIFVRLRRLQLQRQLQGGRGEAGGDLVTSESTTTTTTTTRTTTMSTEVLGKAIFQAAAGCCIIPEFLLSINASKVVS